MKVLERLCDSILNQISGSEMEMSVEMSQVQKCAKPTKSHRSQLLTPALHFNQKKVRFNTVYNNSYIKNPPCCVHLWIINITVLSL